VSFDYRKVYVGNNFLTFININKYRRTMYIYIDDGSECHRNMWLTRNSSFGDKIVVERT